MRNGLHHAANRFVVNTLDDLVEPRKAKTLHNRLVLGRGLVLGAVILNANLLGLSHD